MPKASDLTGGMHRLRGLKGVDQTPPPQPDATRPVATGRKLRVDWFFRSAWLVLILVLLMQFVLLGSRL